MKNPIKTFEPNERGRDFVVGDLHGSYEVFENMLKGIQFDETKDRMFSVGDLVDRGPSSYECLQLLRKPWFHCVLANHEQMMLEAFDGGYGGALWFHNGGFWAAEAINDWQNRTSFITDELRKPGPPSDKSADIFDLLRIVRELPFLITINMKDGKKFHVIHAELPPGHEITDDTLSSPGKVEALSQVHTKDGSFFCWGRFVYGKFYDKDLNNFEKIKRTVAYNGTNFSDKLSHIISGHTIVHSPLTILGQTDIDTAAWASYFRDAKSWQGLTCVQLDTWNFFHATATTFFEKDPVVVNKQHIEELRTKPTSAFGEVVMDHRDGLEDRVIGMP